MRTLNQQEIAAVQGALSITDVVNAWNGKPATGLFVSQETKIITALIALAAPYVKDWIATQFPPKTTTA